MSHFDDRDVRASRQEYWGASGFAVEAGATGPRGGDAGHGSRVVLTLQDLGGTAWEVEIDGTPVSAHERVTIRFGGDSEGANILHALEFAALAIRQQWLG